MLDPKADRDDLGFKSGYITGRQKRGKTKGRTTALAFPGATHTCRGNLGAVVPPQIGGGGDGGIGQTGGCHRHGQHPAAANGVGESCVVRVGKAAVSDQETIRDHHK